MEGGTSWSTPKWVAQGRGAQLSLEFSNRPNSGVPEPASTARPCRSHRRTVPLTDMGEVRLEIGVVFPNGSGPVRAAAVDQMEWPSCCTFEPCAGQMSACADPTIGRRHRERRCGQWVEASGARRPLRLRPKASRSLARQGRNEVRVAERPGTWPEGDAIRPISWTLAELVSRLMQPFSWLPSPRVVS